MNKSTILFKNLLSVLCIHWIGIILTIFLNHILKVTLIDWGLHPWFRLGIVTLEIVFIYNILTSDTYIKRIEQFSIIWLGIAAAILLFFVQIRSVYDVNYSVCAFSLLDGSFDGVFEQKAQNTEYVYFIESCMYILAILFIGFHISRKSRT